MMMLEGVKKKSKQDVLAKLIAMMHQMEAKEPDPLSEHQNQEDKILDKDEDIIEPDYDEAGLPHEEEPDPTEKDEAGDFAKEREAFMKRSSKNPHVKGKSRMIMLAESRPKMSMGSKRGY